MTGSPVAPERPRAIYMRTSSSADTLPSTRSRRATDHAESPRYHRAFLSPFSILGGAVGFRCFKLTLVRSNSSNWPSHKAV